MKTTICILSLCVLSISGQQNRQILFPENVQTSKEILNVPRHINQVTSSSYDKEVEKAFTDGVTRLTLNLNNRVPYFVPSLANSDIAYGPLTIAGALSLIMLASVGDTTNEIAHMMGLTEVNNYLNNPLAVHEPISRLLDKIDNKEKLLGNEIVSYATGIFVQSGFPIRQEFLKACAATYNSDIHSLNFMKKGDAAQEEINNWVSRHTNGKIPKLFHGPPPPDTTAIIASVLYFKAAWEYPFFDGYTKPKPFYVNGRNRPSDRNVDMMANGGEFPYFKDRNLNVEIMGFPYKGKRITMYVLLPTDSSQENLRNLEGRLMPEHIQQLVNSTRITEAVITFPKLKIVSSIDLKSIFEGALNIHSLFNPSRSNMALMSSGKNVVQNHSPVAQNGFVPSPSSTTRVPNNQYPINTETPSVGTQNKFASTGQPNLNQQFNPTNYQENNPLHVAQNNYGPNPSFGTPNSYQQNQFAATQNSYPTSGAQNVNQQNNPGYRAQNNDPSLSMQNTLQQFPLEPQNSLAQGYRIGTSNNNAQNNVVQTHSRREANNYPQGDRHEQLIFIRSGELGNQTEHRVLSPNFESSNTNPLDDLNKIRQHPNLINPGIYADQIIHKVYIEITESGTEAASVTGISLNRSGGRVSFRLDVPFLFFIYHEETQNILFWGSVKNPTPSQTPTSGP